MDLSSIGNRLGAESILMENLTGVTLTDVWDTIREDPPSNSGSTASLYFDLTGNEDEANILMLNRLIIFFSL